MMRMAIVLPIVAVLGATALSSVFTVDERERALVLQFGQVTQVVTEPGLHFKLPFIQDVLRYDDRILGLPTRPLEVTPLDDRRLVVDAFARWRIVDLVKFRRAVGPGGISAARDNLDKIINAEIREVLGGVPSNKVLSQDRTALMNQIRDNSRAKAASLGIEVIDVRLTRTDLPKQNLDATYARMRAEREREAADEIARGNEAAQKLRAEADRQAVEITSEAKKNAEIVRGTADAERLGIYAAAYGKDPEFFAFSRSLSAYETAMTGQNTTMVLSPGSDFFRYLANPWAVTPMNGQAAAPSPAGSGPEAAPAAGAALAPAINPEATSRNAPAPAPSSGN